jgi:hypothetical protein
MLTHWDGMELGCWIPTSSFSDSASEYQGTYWCISSQVFSSFNGPSALQWSSDISFFYSLLRSHMGSIALWWISDVWLLQGSWYGWCGSRFEGKFEEMNANDAPVDTPPSGMAMSHQHESTPIMQELGRSMSELGPLGNHDTSSPSSTPSSPHNDPACGIMKITPVEVTVSTCFLHQPQ